MNLNFSCLWLFCDKFKQSEINYSYEKTNHIKIYQTTPKPNSVLNTFKWLTIYFNIFPVPTYAEFYTGLKWLIIWLKETNLANNKYF
jgi:hypothetical protein